jgi:hypothetical protein
MEIGFRNWGRLFGARFLTGILVLLGLIAFIIPGIVLLVRYAFLDEVVVLEGADALEARRRSTELTVGRRWQILAAGFLFFVSFMLCSFVVQLSLALLPELDTMVINVIIDCLLDIAYVVIHFVMFLYYWEAARGERVIPA